jgi:biopolymer transport protein ExbD/biopolymer transport protein TolR
MSRRRRGERMVLNAEINVVSLIDVMMLLMVIFMITAPMMTGGVDVALPSAQATPLEANKAMTVTVTKAGEIFVDETRLTFQEFSGAFKALAAQHADGGAYLRADAGASYGDVVRVLAVMRASGVPNVGLVVEPEATP